MLCLFLLLLLLVSPSLAAVKRSAVNNELEPERLWPTDRSIYYTFSANFTTDNRRTYIHNVLEDIQKKSCLQFKDVSEEITQKGIEKKDYPILLFVNSTLGACQSYIGRNESLEFQPIHLVDYRCSIMSGYSHEILHALGLHHTHRRLDRDDYLTVYGNRTEPGWEAQYAKLLKNDSKTYGVPYDFNSVMHYGSSIDPKTGLPDLVAKDVLFQHSMGRNAIGIAHSDFLLLNRLYKCLDKCESSRTVCYNGGFVDPLNCQKCICPKAFGGAFCEDLPDSESLGRHVDGLWSAEYKYATDEWVSPDVGVENGSFYKFFHLKASAGKQIEIRLVRVMPEGGCDNHQSFMEIQLGNFVVGGYKVICGKHMPQEPLLSEGNLVAISLYQIYGSKIFTFMYRSVVHVEKTEAPTTVTPTTTASTPTTSITPKATKAPTTTVPKAAGAVSSISHLFLFVVVVVVKSCDFI